jgi:hypothetical protein
MTLLIVFIREFFDANGHAETANSLFYFILFYLPMGLKWNQDHCYCGHL